MNELLDFETSRKLIREDDISDLKPLEKLIEENFEIPEHSEILRPISIIVFSLSIPM